MTIGNIPAQWLRCLMVVLVSASLASACGFRPRGNITLPDNFRQVYVQAPVQITDELAVFLVSGGATITESPTDADAVIGVLSEAYEDRVVSVDATTGKAREFELLYSLDFSVRMKDGDMLVKPEHMVVRRVYVFDPNAVLGATYNVEALHEDMRRDAAERIIRRMEAALGS